MKKLLYIIVVCFIFVGLMSNTCERVVPEETLSSAYWTSPIMSKGQAESLAKYSLVIVDMENLINNKKSLLTLKKINPKIKIICYTNPMEFFSPMKSGRSIQERWLKESLSHPGWELKTGDGKNAIFWPGMKMMNMSSLCPLSQGKSYSQWLAEKLLSEVLIDPIWDGAFFDNGGGNISWLYENAPYQLDIDGNGVSDNNIMIDGAWYTGLHNFIKSIRNSKGSNFILLANKGSVEFMDVLDGRMFEDWPNNYLGDKKNNGWDQCMVNAKSMVENYHAKYVIFQVKSSSNLEFAVASARLLDNVFVSVGQDNRNFYEIFYYDPGQPKALAIDSSGLFYRDYSKGKVIVRPATKEVQFKSN